ncbi:MAG: 50S ribosomal protein L17 [Clostridia bacterium]|nr:50S ribosomal protein L17 [Clostridia bacterium]
MPGKLGMTTTQRMAVLRNQASNLLWYGRIETTLGRAKELRPYVEKIITLAMNSFEDVVETTVTTKDKKGKEVTTKMYKDGAKKLAARRKIISLTYDIQEQRGKETMADFKARTEGVQHPLIEKIFDEIAPKYAQRAEELGQRGGYTRIYKLGERRGDAAPVAIIELI